jgi:hypothetical protein
MRLTPTATAILAAGLLAVAATGAGRPAASPPSSTAPAAHACTPAWRLVPTPPVPQTPVTGQTAQLSGATVVSGRDAWFAGSSTANGGEAWTLHWDGRTIGAAAAIPQDPFTGAEGAAVSFDSASDGWVLADTWPDGASVPVFQDAVRWSGGRWTTTPLAVAPQPAKDWPQLTAITALSPASAWSVGAVYGAGLLGAVRASAGTLIEHWDGTQWGLVANPAATRAGAVLQAISAASPSDIWAVGVRENAAGAFVPLAEHWNGTDWTVVPVPAGNVSSYLVAVSADGPDDAWAVGAQVEPGTSDLATGLVEHWNGTAWSVVTTLPDIGNSKLTSVYAASPSDVWAPVYTPLPNTDDATPEFLHWNGTAWSTVTVPGPQEYGLDYEYSSVAGTGPDNIWAAGWLTDVGSGVAPLVAHLSCGLEGR